MFKFLVIIGLLICFLDVGGQTCVVKSFRWEDPRDVKGMPKPPADVSGKKCAVIRVETGQKGYVFDFGETGNAVANLEKDSVLWLWVPQGASKVTITNKRLKVNCVYPLGTELEEKVNYVMVLDGDKPRHNLKGMIDTKWVALTSFPPRGANVYIDGFPAGKTPFYGSLPLGNHQVRMEKNKVVMEKMLKVPDQQNVNFLMTFEAELAAFKKANEGAFVDNELNPDFPGGYDHLEKFIRKNMNYPRLAQEKRTEGTVFVQFVISITGKINNVRILRGIGDGCDEEAIRIVKMMPNWIPGRYWDAVVPIMYQIPIQFRLSKKD